MEQPEALLHNHPKFYLRSPINNSTREFKLHWAERKFPEVGCVRLLILASPSRHVVALERHVQADLERAKKHASASVYSHVC